MEVQCLKMPDFLVRGIFVYLPHFFSEICIFAIWPPHVSETENDKYANCKIKCGKCANPPLVRITSHSVHCQTKSTMESIRILLLVLAAIIRVNALKTSQGPVQMLWEPEDDRIINGECGWNDNLRETLGPKRPVNCDVISVIWRTMAWILSTKRLNDPASSPSSSWLVMAKRWVRCRREAL